MPNAFAIVRLLPNGNEILEQTFSDTVDVELVRAACLTQARNLKANQVGRRYIIYGPTDQPGDPYTVDDRIWDSLTDL